MKLIKIIPVVLLGMILSGNVRAANSNDEPYVNYGSALNMESWMFDTNYLARVIPSVEDWMFDESWLEQATEVATLESWMLDDEYLSNETQAVEFWMLDGEYLSGDTQAIEPWMLDTDYLK